MKKNKMTLFRIVDVVEIDPHYFAELLNDHLHYRIEILQNIRTRKYHARLFRYELFNMLYTFLPKGVPKNFLSCEGMLVEDFMVNVDKIETSSARKALNLAIKSILNKFAIIPRCEDSKPGKIRLIKNKTHQNTYNKK